ncbi:MAG: hypothetical protein RL368_1394 [Pseudomonadota bacterium]
MATDIEILRQMIRTENIIKPTEKNGKIELILAEADYSVTVNGLSICDEFLVIKADKFDLSTSFFENRNEQFKRADFIIVAELNNRKVIICLEMKAKKDHENKILAQLKGAQCLVEYCKALGKAFWNNKSFLTECTYHFVSIGHIKNSVKPNYTHADITHTHHEPKNLLKIAGARRIAFNQLLSQLK